MSVGVNVGVSESRQKRTLFERLLCDERGEVESVMFESSC